MKEIIEKGGAPSFN